MEPDIGWMSELVQHPGAPIPQTERPGSKLTLEEFYRIAGTLSGQIFVKVVVDRARGVVHFIDHNDYQFHVDFVVERILGRRASEIDANLDRINESLYFAPDRRFLIAILSLHEIDGGKRFVLETVEVDVMELDTVCELYRAVAQHLDGAISLSFKPANHQQEQYFHGDGEPPIPVVWPREIYDLSDFVPLNFGTAVGRIRVFESLEEYRASHAHLGWQDIIVMDRIPDDIPRVAGIINAEHTTPLSHSNVLAHGWQIPNAVQRGIIDRIDQDKLRGRWVRFRVDAAANQVQLTPIREDEIPREPSWVTPKIHLEAPETARTPIRSLSELRMGDRYRFGTKAANIGELCHVLASGSPRLLGFYRIPRPPRENLLHHLAKYLGVPNDDRLPDAALSFLQRNLTVPRGIAIPFAFQRDFLARSPQVQQQLGRLKMALELDAPGIDQLCIELQQMIRALRIPDGLRDYIDSQIVTHLAGTGSFVVRSSSNAEDLDHFSAAGLYDSVNHVSTADTLFEGIKGVWASLVAPRSVKMRHAAGISLEDSYMGVLVQEEIEADLGGVLVTTNPLVAEGDFRNVFVNASRKSVGEVVSGGDLPYQLLYNTVEGGGRTIAVPTGSEDLGADEADMLQLLAFAGRLLQAHFSRDYTFATPLDIEWVLKGGKIHMLQLRPYANS
jgi:hypothetical protein